MNYTINTEVFMTYKLYYDGQLRELLCDIDLSRLCTRFANVQPATCINLHTSLSASPAEFCRNSLQAIGSLPQFVLQLGCQVAKDLQSLEV